MGEQTAGGGNPGEADIVDEVRIRPEQPGDAEAIRAVNLAAFETSAEADIVDALRVSLAAAGQESVSLVAEVTGTDAPAQVVGHVLLTPTVFRRPVSQLGVPPEEVAAGMGLAPMAVAPQWHGRGIGTMLGHAALAEARRRGVPFVVVLGHPGYYPRFGFEPASRHSLRSDYSDIPDEAFLVVVIDAAEVRRLHGLGTATVCYQPAFDAAV